MISFSPLPKDDPISDLFCDPPFFGDCTIKTALNPRPLISAEFLALPPPVLSASPTPQITQSHRFAKPTGGHRKYSGRPPSKVPRAEEGAQDTWKPPPHDLGLQEWEWRDWGPPFTYPPEFLAPRPGSEAKDQLSHPKGLKNHLPPAHRENKGTGPPPTPLRFQDKVLPVGIL